MTYLHSKYLGQYQCFFFAKPKPFKFQGAVISCKIVPIYFEGSIIGKIQGVFEIGNCFWANENMVAAPTYFKGGT